MNSSKKAEVVETGYADFDAVAREFATHGWSPTLKFWIELVQGANGGQTEPIDPSRLAAVERSLETAGSLANQWSLGAFSRTTKTKRDSPLSN